MNDEGELLRNRLAQIIASEILGPDGYVEHEGDSDLWIWSPESIAEALLRVFDVRLREPQAEETPHGEVVN